MDLRKHGRRKSTDGAFDAFLRAIAGVEALGGNAPTPRQIGEGLLRGSRAHDVAAHAGGTAPPVATEAITHDGQRASAELGALLWHALGGAEEAPEFGRWIRAPHADPIIALSIGRGRRADYAVTDRFARTCAFPGQAVWLIEIAHARGDVPNAVAVWRSPGDDDGWETRCACMWTKERRGVAPKLLLIGGRWGADGASGEGAACLFGPTNGPGSPEAQRRRAQIQRRREAIGPETLATIVAPAALAWLDAHHGQVQAAGTIAADGSREAGIVRAVGTTCLVGLRRSLVSTNVSGSDVSGVIVSVAAGEWRDEAGNPNTASGTSLYLAHNWKVSVADASAEEDTNETIDFEVTLNARDDCKTVTVDWTTADGTAIAGEDYTAASGTLTFAPGETTKTVSVAVVDDTVEDSGETFTLQLSNASTVTLTGVSLTLADAEATGTIFNEESPFASVPQIAGVAQVGNTLEVSFTEAPSGTVTYQWLRGSEEIAGATASTYAPTAEDVGEQLSVRVESGSDSIVSAATAPVWAAPINPPLADGEEELLSTTMTLGSHASGVWAAGYGQMQDQSFGAMDDTAFDDDGTTYTVEQLYVMAGGYLSLTTDSRMPAPAELVVYWNGHQITGLARTGGGGLLVGSTPQPETEYSRYRSGASDGVRVAVSLRRTSVTAQDALTAEFQDMSVETHDGSAPFTFEVRFSESFAVSYLTMRDHAFTVTGGRVTGARRIDNPHHEADGMEPNRVWRITVEPEGSADITIALPATTDCTATGAICTADDRPLSAAVTEVVPGEAVTSQVSSTPFAVRFEGVPEEHDGTADVTFQVMFNKEPAAGYSYRTMRDETLVITQGGQSLNAKRAKRLNKPNNDQWRITIAPTSKDDIDVSIVAHTDCSATGAICAEGNEALSSTVSETILGPPGLSVADARVEEAEGATVDFTVTMSRTTSETVTVDYGTSDGSATAGSDYTTTSGTLTFAAGETAVHSTNVLIQSHILAGVKGSDCFRYLIDGKTLSAFGTRIGAGDLRAPPSRVRIRSCRGGSAKWPSCTAATVGDSSIPPTDATPLSEEYTARPNPYRRGNSYAARGHGGGACADYQEQGRGRLRAQDPAPLALDEEPDHGFPATPGVAHRDQAAVGRRLVGIGPDVVALRRQPG